jgi:hypothetical protein
MTKKKRKIERTTPNTDTLNLNMRQVVNSGYFPLVTAYSKSISKIDLSKIREKRNKDD